MHILQQACHLMPNMVTAAARVCTPDTACTEGHRPAASCSRSTWGLAAKLSQPPTLKTCLRGPTETVPLSHSPARQHEERGAMPCPEASGTDDFLRFIWYTHIAEEVARCSGIHGGLAFISKSMQATSKSSKSTAKIGCVLSTLQPKRVEYDGTYLAVDNRQRPLPALPPMSAR